jgi:Oxidoreductase molybdopterin binding domain
MRHFRHRYGLVCLSLLIAFSSVGVLAASSADSEPALHVGGDVPKPGDWTVMQLRQDFASDIKAIQYSSRGQQHTCNCVPLLSVLNAAGMQSELKMNPNADPKTKNYELRIAVVVEGSDGYVVAFSLAELLADIGNRHAWLALDMDGQPLSARDGPVRLIVPDDGKPARWVRGVQTISVVNCAAPTTRPAN